MSKSCARATTDFVRPSGVAMILGKLVPAINRGWLICKRLLSINVNKLRKLFLGLAGVVAKFRRRVFHGRIRIRRGSCRYGKAFGRRQIKATTTMSQTIPLHAPEFD